MAQASIGVKSNKIKGKLRKNKWFLRVWQSFEGIMRLPEPESNNTENS